MGERRETKQRPSWDALRPTHEALLAAAERHRAEERRCRPLGTVEAAGLTWELEGGTTDEGVTWRRGHADRGDGKITVYMEPSTGHWQYRASNSGGHGSGARSFAQAAGYALRSAGE